MSSLSFVLGDTQPSLFGTLTIAGVVVDLTNATNVNFQMRRTIDNRYTVDAVAAIVTPSAGAVRYDWEPGDLAVAGTYVGRWEILWSDSTIQHSDPVNGIEVAL